MTDAPKGLGYRQRAALAVLQACDHPVPFGYVARACDDGCPSSLNNTSVTLRLLRQRGLAVQPRRGWWAAA